MKPIKHEDLGSGLSGRVIGAAMQVHREFGPGLEEADYEQALHLELLALGIEHACQVPLPLIYKGAQLDCGYRMDLIVMSTLLLELKAVDKLHPLHEAQLLTYLRLAKLKLGLLMNFNVLLLKDSILRRANSLNLGRVKAATPVSGHFDELSREVLDAAVEVQSILGTGLLRSAYEICLAHELKLRGIQAERSRPVNLIYRDQVIPSSKQLPLIVGGELLVSCLCVEEVSALQIARSKSLLKPAGLKNGLCINFHATQLTGEIKRFRHA